MITRRMIAEVTVAAVTAAAAATLAAVPAEAHHTGVGECRNEIGIWTESDRARQGLKTKEHMVQARVSYVPPTARCKEGWTTQWWKRTSANYNVIPTADPQATSAPTFLWYDNYAVDGQTEYINARVTGHLIPPVQESVNLYVTTDGGVKVWFDGNLVIDEWHDHSSTTMYWYATPTLLTSKQYQVRIEYFHKTGPQKLELHWKTTPTGIVRPESELMAGDSTQHSSLHAKSAEGCAETVAQRESDGELWIWGYGCTTPELDDGDLEYLSLGMYPADYVTLFQRWNGADNPTTWGHWVYSWDPAPPGPRWIYIGSTGPRPEEMYGWLESSGYNTGVARQTTFKNYQEAGSYVDFTVCPETLDEDPHQAMDRWYSLGPGDARFFPASNAEDTC